MTTILTSRRRSSVGPVTAFTFALVTGMFTTLIGTSAKAAPVTIDLFGTVIGAIDASDTGEFNGIFDGNFKGTLGLGTMTLDDSLFTGTDFQIQDPNQGMTLAFTIFGQEFDETTSAFFPFEPSLGTNDGEFAFFSFGVSETDNLGSSNFVGIDEPGIFAFQVLNSFGGNGFIFDDNTGAVSGLTFDIGVFETGIVSAVSVPAALPLFGTGLAVMGFVGWRRKRKATAA